MAKYIFFIFLNFIKYNFCNIIHIFLFYFLRFLHNICVVFIFIFISEKISLDKKSKSVDITVKFKNLDINFGYYLAGLIEGDGYISITKENRVILGITFNIKDKPLAVKLLEYIGCKEKNRGSIYKRKTNCIELRFSDKKSLERIINLINGKFRTPKIDQLHKLIDWFNLKHSTDIIKFNIDNSSLHNNSWLTGFIDADGSFYIRYSDKQIICKFNLEQRMIYHKTQESFFSVLHQICLFLNINLNIRTRLNKKNSYFIIRVENQNSIQILINYLNNYPLMSSKYLDFLDWNLAFNEIFNKRHFSDEGKKIIYSAKFNMNNNRNYFNWEHLKILECRLP
jgi:hypothetical protein